VGRIFEVGNTVCVEFGLHWWGRGDTQGNTLGNDRTARNVECVALNVCLPSLFSVLDMRW
jgi:hypothetical protein